MYDTFFNDLYHLVIKTKVRFLRHEIVKNKKLLNI